LTWPTGDRRRQADGREAGGYFPARRYQGQNYAASMRVAQILREIAAAPHMGPARIASGIVGELARRRNHRRLLPDPVRLAGVGVEALLRSAP
jgi:hypothetical protein